jgi:hypothetical protein
MVAPPKPAQSLDIRVNAFLPRGAAPRRSSFVVNGGPPELFPVMSLVKKEFTRREIEERRAFGRAGEISYNLLKKQDILSSTNCPLNLI